MEDVSGGVLSYNSRIFNQDWDKIQSPYENMFTNSSKKEIIYTLLHVSESTKNPVFEPSSANVSLAYQWNNLEDYSQYYNFLIEQNYTFIVMSGEFDSRDGAISQDIWMK